MRRFASAAVVAAALAVPATAARASAARDTAGPSVPPRDTVALVVDDARGLAAAAQGLDCGADDGARLVRDVAGELAAAAARLGLVVVPDTAPDATHYRPARVAVRSYGCLMRFGGKWRAQVDARLAPPDAPDGAPLAVARGEAGKMNWNAKSGRNTLDTARADAVLQLARAVARVYGAPAAAPRDSSAPH